MITLFTSILWITGAPGINESLYIYTFRNINKHFLFMTDSSKDWYTYSYKRGNNRIGKNRWTQMGLFDDTYSSNFQWLHFSPFNSFPIYWTADPATVYEKYLIGHKFLFLKDLKHIVGLRAYRILAVEIYWWVYPYKKIGKIQKKIMLDILLLIFFTFILYFICNFVVIVNYSAPAMRTDVSIIFCSLLQAMNSAELLGKPISITDALFFSRCVASRRQ